MGRGTWNVLKYTFHVLRSTHYVMETTPQLTAVGLGPGDPELITVKGMRTIQTAQLIFVPRSKSGEQSLALRIAQPMIDPARQQIVELPLPMTRNADQLIPAWQVAADQIADSFSQHIQATHGVYLLLGDPLLYGTFTYIWAELAQRHPGLNINIIPGVTSFAATAAQAQFILSTTSDRVAIIPATYETDEVQLRQLLTDFDTIILMKVGRVLPQIITALSEMKLLESTLYAERIGMPEEKVLHGVDLNQLQNKQVPYLSLLIVRQSSRD